MEILDNVNKVLASKLRNRKWLEEYLPVVVEVNRQIKAIDKAQDEEIDPYRAEMAKIREKYAVALKPLSEMNLKLRERVIKEYEGNGTVKAEGIGELVFPETWGYTVQDFSKVPKELRMEVVNDRAIKEAIKKGIRNIKGLLIEKVVSLRVLINVQSRI